MILQEIIKQQQKIEKLYKGAEDSFAALRSEVVNTNCFLVEIEDMIRKDLNADRILKGRNILDIEGRVTDIVSSNDGMKREWERKEAYDYAMKDIANKFLYVKKNFVGIKNYSGFGDQRADCSYGEIPRHGKIVFSIGLTSDYRERIKTIPPTDEEIEDALYLLISLPKLEEKKND